MNVLTYLQETILGLRFGLGFVLTKALFVVGAVLLKTPAKKYITGQDLT